MAAPGCEAMAKEPLKNEAEVEVICPRCGYHLTRTAARLRRDTPVICPNCGAEVVLEGHQDSPVATASRAPRWPAAPRRPA
jgi:predicted RNA-binding Zn-ribbon protein involved in translation (DUF1610 family)